MTDTALANALAATVLRLRGQEAQTFVEQFSSYAAKPSAVRIDGDGVLLRQALCFPVLGAPAQKDCIAPFPGLPVHLLIELGSGHVVAFRINDVTPGRLSPSVLIRSIERYLEVLMSRDSSSWSSVERMIEGAQRRHVKLFDFVLDDDPEPFWREYFPQGAIRLASYVLRGVRFTDGGRKQVIAALYDAHSASYREVCGDFMRRLDGTRIRAIGACGLAPHVSRYNSFINCNANSLYRIQAAEAIPLLGYLLGVDGHRAERLRRLVDEGQPLWPALADMLGVAEETIRWLRDKTVEEVGEAWLRRMHTLLPDLSGLAPEKRPRNRDEWTAYTDFILVLNQHGAAFAKKHWLKDLARLGWVQARRRFSAINALPCDLLEVHDFLCSLTDALFYELVPGAHALDAGRDNGAWEKLAQAIEQQFFAASIMKQVRASLRWHELQLQPPDDELAEESPDRRDLSNWPAPWSGPVALGGLYGHFLVSPQQLKEEGMRLQHCVGGYDYHCLFGGSSIMSLRDGHGRSLSTAEFRLDERAGLMRMALVQHKARNNGEPPASAVRAVHHALAMLNDEKMLPRLQEMGDQLRQRQARDKLSRRWQACLPNAPERLRLLQAALKLHVGYERFIEAGRDALAR